jgi:hypothetical protein
MSRELLQAAERISRSRLIGFRVTRERRTGAPNWQPWNSAGLQHQTNGAGAVFIIECDRSLPFATMQPMSPGSNERLDKATAGVGGFVFFAGIVIIGWQVYYWLNFGHWYPISLRTALIQLGIPLPRFSWFSVQMIWDACAEMPLSLYVFVLSAIIMACAAYLTAKELRKRQPRAVEAKQPRRQWKV